ncbi:hypothetical protein [Sulfitobacter sp. 20_GPM-1509m]|uniref:hypothetical protein n=1 Tax=Sulfitobacter sp. 20_GPM-1509m TaxID=1380367 RepID=UPI00049003C1|nr:hypothetical protein [Sulfitobacter sp. 20_GPM-1509m]
MTTRVISTPEQQADVCAILGNIEKLPITVTWVQGKDRTGQQNALAFKWYKEIAEQLGDREPHEVRADCKLHIGVKMMVTEDETFREAWHRLMLTQFTMEQKLQFMVEPLEMPITRLMSTRQMTRYLEAIIARYAPMGVHLTIPEDKL